MPFDILAYKDKFSDYYSDKSLDDVAKDVYSGGGFEKFADYDTWKKDTGIEAIIQSDLQKRTPKTWEDKLREGVTHAAPKQSDGNIVKSFLQGGAEGLTTELPSMIGEALEFTGSHLPFKGIEKAGKSLKEWAEEKRRDLYGEEVERTGLDRIVYEGTKMLAPSLIPGGIVGTAARGLKGVSALRKAGKLAEATKAARSSMNIAGGAVAGLFGLSQAQQTKETAEERGVDPGLTPYATGAIEAAGEFLGTKYLAKLFRLDEAEIVKRGAKEFIKDLIKTIGVEVGTETGQSLGVGAIEKASGIRPEAKPIQEAIDVIGPTVFMTILTGGLAGATNKLRSDSQEERVAAQHIEKLKTGAMLSMTIDEGFKTGKVGDEAFTPVQAIELIKTATDGGVYSTDDVIRLKERYENKYPEFKKGLDDILNSAIKNDINYGIDAGLKAGEIRGKEFTPQNALDIIKDGYEKGLYNDTDIDAFRDKYPALRQGLNDIVVDSAINKVNEALSQPVIDKTLDITEIAKPAEPSIDTKALNFARKVLPYYPAQKPSEADIAILQEAKKQGRLDEDELKVLDKITGVEKPAEIVQPEISKELPAPLSQTDAATVGVAKDEAKIGEPSIDYAAEAKKAGVTFNGMQESKTAPPMPVFTDPETKTTFMLNEGESIPDALSRKRQQFAAAKQPVIEPVVENKESIENFAKDSDVVLKTTETKEGLKQYLENKEGKQIFVDDTQADHFAKTRDKKFREALGITTAPEHLEFIMFDMKSAVEGGTPGGLQGKDAAGNDIYAGSGYPDWVGELVKKYSNKKTAPILTKQDKAPGIDAARIKVVLTKGINGDKLTPYQQVVWEDLNRIADRESTKSYAKQLQAFDEVRGVYEKYPKAEREEIHTDINRANQEIRNTIDKSGRHPDDLRKDRPDLLRVVQAGVRAAYKRSFTDNGKTDPAFLEEELTKSTAWLDTRIEAYSAEWFAKEKATGKGIVEAGKSQTEAGQKTLQAKEKARKEAAEAKPPTVEGEAALLEEARNFENAEDFVDSKVKLPGLVTTDAELADNIAKEKEALTVYKQRKDEANIKDSANYIALRQKILDDRQKLTDIWNKAQEGDESLTERAARVRKETVDKFADEAASTETITEREIRRKREAQEGKGVEVKTETTSAGKQYTIPGASEAETFSLANPETEISPKLSEQVKPKNAEMFAEDGKATKDETVKRATPGEKTPYILEEGTTNALPAHLSKPITDKESVGKAATIISGTIGRNIAPENLRLYERTGMDDLGKLGGAFQKKVMVFQVQGENLPELPGFFSPKDSSAIYLNATTPDPHLTILGHELLHALKHDAPDIYKNFISHVQATEQLRESAKIYQEGYGGKAPNSLLVEEYIAEYMGKRFTQKSFWNDLANQKPNIFKKVYDSFTKLVDKIKGIDFSSDMFFRDIKKAEQLSSKAMADYAERMRTKEGKDVLYSYKDIATDKNLAIVHNLTVKNLQHVIKMGGLAAPSVAVIDIKKSKFDSFGDITLIANKDTLGPGASKSNKYFNADAYSPRYPKVTTFLTDKSSKALNDYLAPLWKEIPAAKDNQGGMASHYVFMERIKDVGVEKAFTEGDPILYYAFLKEHGKLPEGIDKSWEGKTILRKTVEEQIGKDKYDEWALAKIKEMGIEVNEKIFNGFTFQGNRKYLKHDLDTVVRLLKKELKDGEGFNYGAPSIRAKNAMQFRTVKQIQDNRDKIISSEAMEKLKEETNDELMRLANETTPFLKYKSDFGNLDNFTEHIKEAIDTHNFNKVFGENSEYYNSGVNIQPIVDYVNKLRNMPTEYFEGKIQRAVDITEFERAVVPENTPKSVIDWLDKKGIKVDTYKNAEDRNGIVKKAVEESNLNFSLKGEQVSDKSRPGNVTIDTIKKHPRFQSANVTENKDGSAQVIFPNGDGFKVDFITDMADKGVRLETSYGNFRKVDKRVAGAYVEQNKTILFNKDRAGIPTIDHEHIHFLEKSGYLDSRDTRILNLGAKRAGFEMTEEGRAEFVAQAFEKRDAQVGMVKQVLQKISDFFDMVMNAVGHRTTGGVLRDIESGKIMEAKGEKGAAQILQTGQAFYSNRLPAKAILIKGGEQINIRDITNRRFMYNPQNNELVLGDTGVLKGKGVRSSHAEEFHNVGASGKYDDAIRGWLGTSKKYPNGIIHFAPDISKETFSKYPDIADQGLKTIEYFLKNGATGNTVIRNFVNMGEHKIKDVFPELLSQSDVSYSLQDTKGTKYEDVLASLKQFIPKDTNAGKVNAMYDRTAAQRAAREAISFKNIKNGLLRSMVDVSGNLKREVLKKDATLGRQVVMDKELYSGASAKAAVLGEEAGLKIFKGLNSDQLEVLNRVIESRRIIDIDNYKPGVKHPEGLTGKEHAEYLESLKRVNPGLYKDISGRADEYFKTMREQVNELLKEGILTKESAKALNEHEYSPRKFFQYLDPENSFNLGGRKITVPDSGIKSLDEGSLQLLENNAERLMAEVITRTQARIFRNRASKSLYDFAEKVPDNGVVRLAKVIGTTKNGKPIYEDTPGGHEKVKVMINGQAKEMIMPWEMAQDWVKSDPLINQTLATVIGTVSGAKILRPIATGYNPAFAITNMARDIGLVWTGTMEYSSHLPIAAGQMIKDFIKVAPDVMMRKGRVRAYIDEGGGMTFMTYYGRFSGKGFVGEKLNSLGKIMGWIGETSEIWTRMALRERAIQNGSSAKEATWIARRYIDFNQGGNIAKGIDSAIPYLNAAIQGTRGLMRGARNNPAAFTYKMAQLGTLSVLLYLANYMTNPEAWESITDREKEANFIITTPIYFIDDKGQKKYYYAKIAKEQGHRVVTSLFDALMARQFEGKLPTKQMLMGLEDFLVIPGIPPTLAAGISYLMNKDTWTKEDIWRGPEGIAPKEEYYNRTHPFWVSLGQSIGLSPERMGNALSKVIPPNNPFVGLVGGGYKMVTGDLPQEIQDKSAAQFITEIPSVRRILATTNPYTPYRDILEDIKKESATQNFTQNRAFDDLTEKYLKTKDQKYADEMIAFAAKLPEYDQQRLARRFEYQRKLYKVPDRSWYINALHLPPEAKAVVFWDRYSKLSKEGKNKMIEIADMVGGFKSERFINKLKELASGHPPGVLPDE